ncbi:Invertase/pectin methylesterase inhibitor domain superfamily [Arabidopsis thaliana x Arabidopsis arenosa]|uniref:Pectinesterase n=1 Tax=Arabidopsis thaliana x Arabidopsis arenosa TaxID=1240361 RepID=A0A8T2C6K7_9BRAS|nr:Invertase/pectin methylesterase inhibitor domain superfamily [Arabidopsis thaliana x Arabidopsis arenosa]
MDSVNSFKGYGKVDEAQDLALKKKTRKRLLLLSISVVVLIAVIIAAVVATVVHKKNNESTPSSPSELTPSTSLKAICSVTRFPESCISSISKLPSSNTTDPETLFKLSLKVIIDELDSISDLPEKLSKETEDERIKSALRVCGDLIEDALDRLNDTVSAIDDEGKKKTLSSSKIEDLKTWLSATVTDHDTCFDTLDELKQNKTEYANSTITQNLKSAMSRSTEFTSNSLAIVSKILAALSDLGIPIHRRRRLMSHQQQSVDFEEWARRRLLQTENLKPDVTVASDGTGDVLTVNEAVAMVPKKSLKMFVIYVKSGTYNENVVMDKSKWNVMIYGDGKGKTIISGGKNFVDGTPTYETATFAIQGKGFIMKDIGIINTAGATKHQAVAFRSGSDFSVYYQCSFDGFQDTLYPHSNRQFYRDCDVTGTIDFIFGSAAVVFQGCKIMPRQPLPNQFNTITAQGKKDPNQNSGMSIQRCTISANGNVIAPTYLGRPWKDFSTTVIMETEIGPVVRPSGWMSWVSGVDPPASIVYGEYKNTGPGSDVTKRVKWAGYKSVMSDAEAAKFTVATLLHGGDWIPATGVTHQLS